MDVVELDQTIFSALAGGPGLLSGQFITGVKALTADDHLIYNNTTGALLYDADGSGQGKAVQFATLSAHLNLHDTDFRIG